MVKINESFELTHTLRPTIQILLFMDLNISVVKFRENIPSKTAAGEEEVPAASCKEKNQE